MCQLTSRLALFILAILAAVLLGAGPAAAQTQTCQFTISAPGVLTTGLTISTEGVHCLMTDVTMAASFTRGAAIEITANNVVLDLNGHKVVGVAAGTGTLANGILASDRQNITIKNGTVRGFQRGIFLQDLGASSGHVVEGVRLDANTFIGISIHGTGILVRNNQVVNTGGTTVDPTSGLGIFVFGAGAARVLNNDVITVTKTGTGTAWGIRLSSAPDALVVGNRITTADKGIEFFGSSGKYRDNLTSGVTTPFTGGTDAGNNN